MHSISNAIASKEELMTPVIMPVVNSKNEVLIRENSSDNLKGNRANRHVLDNIDNVDSSSAEILEDLDINFENGISNKRRRVEHDYRKLSSSVRLSDDETSPGPSLTTPNSIELPNNQLPASNGILVDISIKHQISTLESTDKHHVVEIVKDTIVTENALQESNTAFINHTPINNLHQTKNTIPSDESLKSSIDSNIKLRNASINEDSLPHNTNGMEISENGHIHKEDSNEILNETKKVITCNETQINITEQVGDIECKQICDLKLNSKLNGSSKKLPEDCLPSVESNVIAAHISPPKQPEIKPDVNASTNAGSPQKVTHQRRRGEGVSAYAALNPSSTSPDKTTKNTCTIAPVSNKTKIEENSNNMDGRTSKQINGALSHESEKLGLIVKKEVQESIANESTSCDKDVKMARTDESLETDASGNVVFKVEPMPTSTESQTTPSTFRPSPCDKSLRNDRILDPVVVNDGPSTAPLDCKPDTLAPASKSTSSSSSAHKSSSSHHSKSTHKRHRKSSHSHHSSSKGESTSSSPHKKSDSSRTKDPSSHHKNSSSSHHKSTSKKDSSASKQTNDAASSKRSDDSSTTTKTSDRKRKHESSAVTPTKSDHSSRHKSSSSSQHKSEHKSSSLSSSSRKSKHHTPSKDRHAHDKSSVLVLNNSPHSDCRTAAQKIKSLDSRLDISKPQHRGKTTTTSTSTTTTLNKAVTTAKGCVVEQRVSKDQRTPVKPQANHCSVAAGVTTTLLTSTTTTTATTTNTTPVKCSPVKRDLLAGLEPPKFDTPRKKLLDEKCSDLMKDFEKYLFPKRRLDTYSSRAKLHRNNNLKMKTGIIGKFKSLLHCERDSNGGGLSLHAYSNEITSTLTQQEQEQFADYYFDEAFKEVDGNSVYTIAVVHEKAVCLPDPIEYMAYNYPDLIVKTTALGRLEIDTSTALDYRNNVHRTFKANCHQSGGLNHISMVGVRQEETGTMMSEYLDRMEKCPFLNRVMPWGSRSLYDDMSRGQSNDGPILWSRPGEQLLTTRATADSRSPYKRQRINELKNLQYLPRGNQCAREQLVEDRTRAHADHVGYGPDRMTTAAVGMLKAVHCGHCYHDDCITKDCVLWAAKDFNDVTRIMKLDLHEPPMSQCIMWADSAKLLQMRREGIKYSHVQLRDNDIYFIPRNIIHQFRSVTAVTSIAWHVRLKAYYPEEESQDKLSDEETTTTTTTTGSVEKPPPPQPSVASTSSTTATTTTTTAANTASATSTSNTAAITTTTSTTPTTSTTSPTTSTTTTSTSATMPTPTQPTVSAILPSSPPQQS